MSSGYRAAAFYERTLRKHVLPAWQGRTLDSIKLDDVRHLAEEIADDRPIAANRLLSILSSMFAWAVHRGIMAASPAEGVKKPASEKPRERVLDASELRLVMDAAYKLPALESDFVFVLLLTMARRSEVAGMVWSEIDLPGEVWTIPGDRTKNGREHRLPLSAPVLAILETRWRNRGDYDFVFPWRGKAYTNFSRLKVRLDALVTQENGGVPITPWTLHDLRRTGASAMPALGVNLATTERILNHVSGSFGGIVSVYQRYNYLPEMRDAMSRWAGYLSDDVKQLRRRA
jgi:integrase